jgi:geranylgeranyl diphosphate synthase type I
MKYFEENKTTVGAFIDAYLTSKKQEFEGINRWGGDVIEKLRPYVKDGKMIRSGLVRLGYRMCGRKRLAPVIPAAAAVEFIQTALLIHDDIIDNDALRRGRPSVHFQYDEQGAAEDVADSRHFGVGMGICVGDIGFFLAFELLSGLKAACVRKHKVVELWARELSRVGLAQMQDLYFGAADVPMTQEDILDLYLYKTARYSFSMPLLTGGHLGGGSGDLLKRLNACGEYLGLLFQLRDDELGLYGSEPELGKPVGSDIRENKKTPFTYFLFREASPRDRRRLKAIFGRENLTKEKIEEVRAMLEAYEINGKVRSLMHELSRRAETGIRELPVPPADRTVLSELLEYIVARQR